MRPVPDERRAFLDERRDDDLAGLTVWDGFQGHGIDDLDIKEVVPVMHAGVVLAVDADAGTVDLGQAVDVVEFDAEFFGDAFAHRLAPALGTDDTFLQVDLVLDAALFDLLGEEQGIGGCGAEDGGLHVDHHLELFVGVAGTHGDGHGAEFFRACLEADARGPQTVTGSDVDAVFLRDAGGLIAAGEHGGPVIHVFCRVGDDDRKAGGARGGVDADDVFLRSRHEAQGVGVTQVCLFGERQGLELFLCGDAGDAGRLELFAVETACFDQRVDLVVDLLQLQFRDFHGELLLSTVLWVAIHAFFA